MIFPRNFGLSYRVKAQQVKKIIFSLRHIPSHQITRSAIFGSLLLCSMFSATTAASDEPIAEQIGFAPSDANSALPDGVDETTGFRMDHYRRPVPDTNPGTEVVNTERALELHKSGKVIFIDVFPPRGLGADPLDGTWLTNEVHQTIVNATWLPEVGRGYIEQEHIDYFERNLLLLTNNDKSIPILFYCTADCWQSWNAARRAFLWGYETVFWYPAGTDGWLEEGHPLVVAEPVNFLGETE